MKRMPWLDHKQQSLLFDELRGMTSLALPVVSTYFLEMLPGLVSIVMVGHYHDPHTTGTSDSSSKTKEYLDATALAVAFMNLAAMSVGVGLTTAMDTLCAQAYGAGETHKMGTYLQTGLIVLAIFCLAVGLVFYNATSILLALGQPEELSVLAGLAVWTLLPGIPFLFLYELLRKVLQSQNIATPMVIASVAANLVNIAAGHYLMNYTSWGWLGASAARTLCSITFFLVLFPYILASGLVHSFWAGLRWKEAVAFIPLFLSLGIPGMLQLCFEWWAFEVLALLCGLLPNAVVSIGANAIILNVSAIVFMIFLGLSIAGNVRIGNALGAGDTKRASVAAYCTIALCSGMACLSALFLIQFRYVLPKMFSSDQTINDLATSLIVVVAIFQLPDSINAAVQGVFRGSGRQNLGARLNFVAYYLLGIPFGCVLAFVFDLGVVGLWAGMTVGLTFIAIVGTNLIWRSDWKILSVDAKNRVRGGETQSSTGPELACYGS